MKSIQEDIETGNFRPVYLLYGEEAYLKRQYRQKLRNALAAEDDTMNVAIFQGKNINQARLSIWRRRFPFLQTAD